MPLVSTSEKFTKDIARRIKLIINMTGVTHEQFAAINNLSRSTIRNWLYGHNATFTMDAAKKVVETAAKCGVTATTNWILRGAGLGPRVEGMLYVDKLHQEMIKKELNMEKEVNDFSEIRSDHMVLLISDDSMLPAFRAGDYVGGRAYRGDDINDICNLDCIVKLPDKPILCRRLVKNRFDSYDLKAINIFSEAEYPMLYNVQVECAAPVIRLWRELKV